MTDILTCLIKKTYMLNICLTEKLYNLSNSGDSSIRSLKFCYISNLNSNYRSYIDLNHLYLKYNCLDSDSKVLGTKNLNTCYKFCIYVYN